MTTTLLLLSLLFFASITHATNLREVELLVKAGASTLALKVLNKEQPGLTLNPEQWLEWERQRIKLYQDTHAWDKLIKRLGSNPDWVPNDFKRWSREQIAQAWLEKKNIPQTLKYLRELVWQYSQDDQGQVLSIALSGWRQRIIQTYLLAGNIHDAEVAMLRFQQDENVENESWKRLRATVLILAGKPEDAAQLLAKARHMHSRAIYYQAQLKIGKLSPGIILKRSLKYAGKSKFTATTRRQFWLLASRAALKTGDYVKAIQAQQKAILLLDDKQTPTQEERLLFPISGDSLWKLYEQYGRQLGNHWQLLIGNDRSWFTKASDLVDKQPIQAMALFVVLIKDAQVANTRKVAHQLFAGMLAREKQGLQLLHKLYLHPDHPRLLAYIPEELRHRLIDNALSHSDIKTASLLIRSVNEAPKGANVVFWKMRRARIMILAGQVDEGIKALQSLLIETPVMNVVQMDRLMQVIFDLQTVGRHFEAINLFAKLPMEGQTGQRRREVLYWIADSYKSEKKYVQSARYYLLSAGLLNSSAMDPWAQTARYQAADVLVLAGDYEDAGRIYNKLLKITKEPGRRVVLKNKIQQIWLQANQKQTAGTEQ